ncbi:MAG: dienelactone hydrolase family protein [Eubacteriaceae bacterium]|nr:dienelactone hydrolase family protein [Eubacteriaceae bacterium]
MWNDIDTGNYEGMIAETVAFKGAHGESTLAYMSRPIGQGPFPTVVLIPHMPGWDEFYREMTRRFSQHGYIAISPDIYSRFGTGKPDQIAQKAMQAGGVSDDTVLDDTEGALSYAKSLPISNGKAGVIGTCSGGRHAFLAACRLKGIDAAVDCWGGRISANPAELTPQQPVSALDYAESLSCPLLGIFGNEDSNPTPEIVDRHEAELKRFGKDYKFFRYDGAGHGFMYYHTEMYRPTQAMDAWEKIFAFFEAHLRA